MKKRAGKGLTAGAFPHDLLIDSDEWKSLPLVAQTLYLLLWLEDTSTHLGTRRFHPTALTQRLPGLDEDDIVGAATELVSNGWIVLDEDDQLIHLRGWLARDGLTTNNSMAPPFRSAWDSIESPTIRESVLNDLRLAYEVDREAHETGRNPRSESRPSTDNKPQDPDRDGSFWTHKRMSPIRSRMPETAQPTPLDEAKFNRVLPLALGRGDGRNCLASFGSYVDIWAFLTLYLRADNAGVVVGPAAMMLSRRATGPEATPTGMRVSVRALAQTGWIESVSGAEGEASRIRFFHMHEGSVRYATRGTSVAHDVLSIESERLRAGVLSDLALAFTLGMGLPATDKQRSFWRNTSSLWEQRPRPRVYDTADLMEHGIGPGLPTWTGTAPSAGQCTWVPRAPISPYSDTHANTVTPTHADTHADTHAHTVIPTHADTHAHSVEAYVSGVPDVANTHADTHAPTHAGDPYMSGIHHPISDTRYPTSVTAPATTDGRTDPPPSDPNGSDCLTEATAWVDDLDSRPDEDRIDIGDKVRLIRLVTAHFETGATPTDLDALVDETLDRDVTNPGGYFLKTLEDPHRRPRSRRARPAVRGSAANAGAAAQPTAPNPFDLEGGR